MKKLINVKVGGFLAGILIFSLLGFSTLSDKSSMGDTHYRVMPSFSQPTIFNLTQTMTEHNFIGQPTLIHVWASWCKQCQMEQAAWKDIAEDWPHQLVGINYRDSIEEARDWLTSNGNPFHEQIYDPMGELGSKLGLSGTPETLVVNENGIIVLHVKGPIDYESYTAQIKPYIIKMGDA